MKVPSVCFVSPYSYALFSGETRRFGGPEGFGGAEVQQSHIARALRAVDFDVRYVSYASGAPRHEEVDGIQFWTVQLPEGGSISRAPIAMGRFWRALRRADADVYYQRCAGSLTGIVGVFALLHRRPFLFAASSDRNLDGSYLRAAPRHETAMYRLGLRLAGEVVVQNKYQERLLRDKWGREGVLIPSICPLPDLSPPPAEKRSGVLWVGKLDPGKRPEIVAELAEALPRESFTVIAPKSGPAAFAKSALEMLQGCANVRYLEGVPYHDMPQHYRQAAVLLSTSVIEGFPNVFAEAWAHRMPVISLDVDPDGIICERGLGVHAKSVDELLEGLKGLVRNPERREKIGTKGEAYIRERHAPIVVARQYRKLLMDIVER